MRKYYTKPCNFFYGNRARILIKNKKALPLAGNKEIAFNQIEVIQRKNKGKTKSEYYSIHKIKILNKKNYLL